MSAGLQEEINWIRRSFQEAARNLAKEAVERFVKANQTIGLGSGPTAAAIVSSMVIGAAYDGSSSQLKITRTKFLLILLKLIAMFFAAIARHLLSLLLLFPSPSCHFFRMLLLVAPITRFNGVKGSAAQFAGHFFCILLRHREF
jgi:hypothetical protein